MSVGRWVSWSKITITTAARASTVSPSRTSARMVNDLVPDMADPRADGVRLAAVRDRPQVVDVGPGDDVVAPPLAAGVQVHQELDAGLLEVLEERHVADAPALVDVGTAHGQVVDVSPRAVLGGDLAPCVARAPCSAPARSSSVGGEGCGEHGGDPHVDRALAPREPSVGRTPRAPASGSPSATSVTQESTSDRAPPEHQRRDELDLVTRHRRAAHGGCPGTGSPWPPRRSRGTSRC